MKIVYQKENIEKVLQLLNSITVAPGITNNGALVEVYNILNSTAEPLKEEKSDN